MNILYHHRTQGRGAEGVHIREVVDALRGLGHHVDVVSPPKCDPYRAEAVPSGKPAELPLWRRLIYSMPQVCFECLEILYNVRACAALGRQAREKSYDGIYERYSFFGVSGVKTAQRLGIPLILEVNEISGIKRQRKQALVKKCSDWERQVFERADALVVVSDFLKEEIAKRGIDPAKIHVIPNAVNTDHFRYDVDASNVRASLFPPGAVVIGFVGMFSNWDRLDWLLEVFRDVRKKAPDAHLLIVGDGTDRPRLTHRVKEMGLEEYVTFTGLVPRKDIPLYIKAVDIGTLAGSNLFGSPIAMFEFMVMGKPVVVPRYNPMEAVIREGENGFLFDPDDAAAYTEKLINCVQDPVLRATMGNKARETILTRHLWKHNAMRIVEVLEGIKGHR